MRPVNTLLRRLAPVLRTLALLSLLALPAVPASAATGGWSILAGDANVVS